MVARAAEQARLRASYRHDAAQPLAREQLLHRARGAAAAVSDSHDVTASTRSRGGAMSDATAAPVRCCDQRACVGSDTAQKAASSSDAAASVGFTLTVKSSSVPGGEREPWLHRAEKTTQTTPLLQGR